MGRIRAGKSLWILLGLLVLTLPMRWMLAVAASMAVHELSHYLAVRLCGGQVYSLYVTASGVQMKTSPLTPAKQLFCALAGPLGGLLLFMLAIKLPRLALCALAHSVFNLIPMYPLDGGKAVENLLVLLFPFWGDRIFLWMQRVLTLVLILVCLWASLLRNLGVLPLILAGFLLAKTDFVNNSCKEGRRAVQ